MARLSILCSLANPGERDKKKESHELYVNANSEFTWISSDVLERIGIAREKERTFVAPDGQTILRSIGLTIIATNGSFTSDEVVFADRNDPKHLGLRTLQGLNFAVNAESNKLIQSTPGPISIIKKFPDVEVWKVIASRRQTHDTMVWQTAGLVFTGQAFLYSIALGHEINMFCRLIALSLSVISAIATIQVMIRHRKYEESDSRWLESFEKRSFTEVFHGRLDPARLHPSDDPHDPEKGSLYYNFYHAVYNFMSERTGLLSESSVKIWISLQAIFGLVSFIVFMYLVFFKSGFLNKILSFCGCS